MYQKNEIVGCIENESIIDHFSFYIIKDGGIFKIKYNVEINVHESHNNLRQLPDQRSIC